MKSLRVISLAAALIFAAALLSSCVLPKVPGKDTDAATDDSTSYIHPRPIETTEKLPEVSRLPETSENSATTQTETEKVPETTVPTPETLPPVHYVPGSVIDSGTLVSNSGTKLNMMLEWKALNTEDPDKIEFKGNIYLECYSIFVGPRSNGLISVGGQDTVFSTNAIEYSGTDFKEFQIGTFSFLLDMNSSNKAEIPVKCEWYFNGVYSGISVDWLRINSLVKISR